MTVYAAQQFDAGPNGAAVALGSGEQIGHPGSAATLTYSSLKPVTGAFSARVQCAAGDYQYLSSTFTPVPGVWHRALWTTPAAAPSASVFLMGAFLGAVAAADVRLNTDMTITLRDRGSSSLAKWTSPVLPPDTRIRIVLMSFPSGGANATRLKLYVGETDLVGATATYDSGPQTTTSSLSTIDQVHTGVLVAAPGGFTGEFDAVSVESVEPAAVAVNPLASPPAYGPPVVDLGGDRTVYPPTVSIVLTAAGSFPAGSGIASYSWRMQETTAPPFTGSGNTRTVVCPVLRFDRTFHYGVTAIDTSGQASDESLIAVTFIAVTEWHCKDDLTLVPVLTVNAG